MKKAPGRDTRPAYSRERRTWYGHGTLTRAEKSGFGRVLHDASYIFGDISVLSLPVLLIIMSVDPPDDGLLTLGALVAWMTMWAVGTTIRGGWISPLATDTLGWVSLRPALLGLRLVYYNLVIAVGAVGGLLVERTLETPYGASAMVFAFVGATVATLSFPRLAESLARWLDS